MSGYVSLPELTRANRNYITILINGRYIKNFLLNRAILDGYGNEAYGRSLSTRGHQYPD